MNNLKNNKNKHQIVEDFLYVYRISCNKLRGAYLIFAILGAALKREQRSFQNLKILFSKDFQLLSLLDESFVRIRE